MAGALTAGLRDTATGGPGATLLRTGRAPVVRLAGPPDRPATGTLGFGGVADADLAGSGNGTGCCGSGGPPASVTAASTSTA
ncbi:hypothetical protein GCM10010399_95370 [Dactylosporangium fulvum]